MSSASKNLCSTALQLLYLYSLMSHDQGKDCGHKAHPSPGVMPVFGHRQCPTTADFFHVSLRADQHCSAVHRRLCYSLVPADRAGDGLLLHPAHQIRPWVRDPDMPGVLHLCSGRRIYMACPPHVAPGHCPSKPLFLFIHSFITHFPFLSWELLGGQQTEYLIMQTQ